MKMDNDTIDHKKASILIVDDELPNLRLLMEMLEQKGFQNVESTDDPCTAVALHQRNDFDLILLDIRMPVKDGFQIMQELRALPDHEVIPVIVLTAQIDLETRHRALEAGAQDFILKPFDLVEICHRIHNFLLLRLLMRERKDKMQWLETMVQARTEQLERTQLEIVRRLGHAGEYRDNETGMHILRMSKYCEIVAEKLGFNARKKKLILHASTMHDVGKIGIPDRILLKPGKLDPDEWEIMKSHVQIGVDLLSGYTCELTLMARLIAATHHEKWDGSGYPNGLSGNEIPIEGRIVAACDVFDALTSKRPYKKAWSEPEAFKYLKNHSGSHFDPDVIGAFKATLKQIREIRQVYTDD